MSEEKKECCPEGKCCPECCEDRAWWTYLFGRRTIMAYAFTGATIVGFLYGMIDPAKFSEMVMMILAFYFMTRKNEKA